MNGRWFTKVRSATRCYIYTAKGIGASMINNIGLSSFYPSVFALGFHSISEILLGASWLGRREVSLVAIVVTLAGCFCVP